MSAWHIFPSSFLLLAMNSKPRVLTSVTYIHTCFGENCCLYIQYRWSSGMWCLAVWFRINIIRPSSGQKSNTFFRNVGTMHWTVRGDVPLTAATASSWHWPTFSRTPDRSYLVVSSSSSYFPFSLGSRFSLLLYETSAKEFLILRPEVDLESVCISAPYKVCSWLSVVK